MALNLYNIKKWLKMMSGNSILHVNQGIGKVYSTSEIKGYYNDLTEKVLKDKNTNGVKIPTIKIENGEEILFPIAIFQYGLGAYDLYLIYKKEVYLKKFQCCVQWAVENQEENGGWKNFTHISPSHPYSSMAQGEGISLLLRGYKEFGDERYLGAAGNALKFMLKDIEEGGTTKYINNEVYFYEFTDKPVVLNGWIFSVFGLIDYLLVVPDERVRKIYNLSIETMINNLERFDVGYWTKYDIDSKMASPFYHDVHIAQLNALYALTGNNAFKMFEEKCSNYKKSWFNRKKAFIIKAYQKLKEK